MAGVIFDSIIVLALMGAVFTAYQWPFATGLFPLTIGIPACIVAVAQLVTDAVVRWRRGAAAPPVEKHVHDIAVDYSIPTRVAVARAGIFLGWICGLFALILLIGFKLAIPIFMLSYMRIVTRAGWLQSLLFVGVILLLMLGLFDHLLHVPWPDSLLPLPRGL